MGKSLKAYIILLLVLFGFIFYVQITAEKPVNWAKTYNETDKIPYGTFIFYNELPELFPESQITTITTSPYEYFEAFKDTSNVEPSGIYMHIDEFAQLDDVSAEKLLDFTAKGNILFLASSYIPKVFLDSLQIETDNNFSFKGKATLNLVNPKFKNDSIFIEKGLTNVYFKNANYKTTTILGTQTFKDSTYTNFIKTTYKKGTFYLHLQPSVYTNFSLLKSKKHQVYTENTLGYLPNAPIFYKSKIRLSTPISGSKLRFILSQPALRYAWYLGLILLVLFIIFNTKRKQRVVKTITPLGNSTLEFIKTIGNLYYETKDHNNLIDKKTTYFLEYIRRVYYLDTQVLDEKLIKNLALKTNRSKKDITTLVNAITQLRAKPEVTEQDLLDLNTLIEEFHNHKHGSYNR
ncbi:DUF4350 domain-containing protein [Aurantibacter aestuarii]|uniref:DUF4350 domain-containing protein n=1 Tax=Aurantibacter aestuarii TaxID=1266046 RepID=A0A2T1N5E2_9FLAO|nr:DUF4350 domain-containing protein [Aurantibacter aestuarii]PSG86430.1 hypothetical protein C7H52_12125 [Aurantibacter aestuarii]